MNCIFTKWINRCSNQLASKSPKLLTWRKIFYFGAPPEVTAEGLTGLYFNKFPKEALYMLMQKPSCSFPESHSPVSLHWNSWPHWAGFKQAVGLWQLAWSQTLPLQMVPPNLFGCRRLRYRYYIGGFESDMFIVYQSSKISTDRSQFSIRKKSLLFKNWLKICHLRGWVFTTRDGTVTSCKIFQQQRRNFANIIYTWGQLLLSSLPA